MAKELKKVLVSSELMTKLAKCYHEKAKATANYDEIVNLVKATVNENESVILATKNNGVQATMKISYQFDKSDLDEKDAKRIEELENEIKAIKAKYDNTKKVITISNIK